ncbi:MAG: DUF5330 domain-containing protein [Salaquimonas sp.]
MFLIRAAFWIALVVAFIPVQQADLEEGQRSVSTLETVGLAQSVMADIGSFCERNSQTCQTGGVLISQMGLKAREGARIAYSWLDERYGDKASYAATDAGLKSGIDPVKTSSINAQQ